MVSETAEQKQVGIIEASPLAKKDSIAADDYPPTEDEQAEPVDEVKERFEDLGITNERTLLQMSRIHNMEQPTPIQSSVIRGFLEGETHHMLVLGRGQAGKTMAAVLATLETVDLNLDKLQAIYVVYSKGMAGRVAGILNDLAPDPTLKVYRATSGSDVLRDIHTLFRSVNHVLVGTPGRVLDLMERGATDFSAVKMVVVDQADLILNLTRRKHLTNRLVQGLREGHDSLKIIALARNLIPGIISFRSSFLGARKCYQISEGRQRRSSERRRRLSRKSSTRSASGAPTEPWKYGIICGEREENVSDELLIKFFNQFLSLMASRGRRRAPWRLEEEPTFITRIAAPPASYHERRRSAGAENEKPEEGREEHSSAADSELNAARFEEYKAAIEEAAEKGVTVVFYTSPAMIGGDGPVSKLKLVASEHKLIFQGLKVDYITKAGEESPPQGLIRGQTNTLLGHYRVLRRGQEHESGRSDAEDTADEYNGESPANERRRLRLLTKALPGVRLSYRNNSFTVSGPATIRLNIGEPTELVKKFGRGKWGRLAGGRFDRAAAGRAKESDVDGGTAVDAESEDANTGAGDDEPDINTQTIEISAGMTLVGQLDRRKSVPKTED
jgi:hypothetical protein